jgi:hypothetical protein
VHDAKFEIEAELDAGERLLWSGAPRQGVVFRGSDVFLIPFSILWGGFAIFWTVFAVGMVAAGGQLIGALIPLLWGTPFVLVGLYLILGRFWVDSRCRARTFYGVTTKRVIIVSGFLSRTITSLDLRTLGDTSLVERSNRSGTITFGPIHPLAKMYAGMQWPGMGSFGHSFEMIADARAVYKVICDAKEPR